MVLFLIIIYYFILELYHTLKKTNKNLFLTFLPFIAVYSILVFIFSFKSIQKIREIIKISIILYVIIYILIVVLYFLRA